ncbi:MAG: MmgE/PrpD family protein [Betaproteobacteria bacterium]|nr:MmgE/PrpD family protein [Betaproteobacteria bacterium]MBI3053534.1 MmgE/PrpD family protein [Betaproteobacteria bacterium]
MKTKPIAISPLMRKLSTYISTALKKPLPPEVAERAKIHLLDTLSAIISGSRLPPGTSAIEYVKGQGGKPEATVFGTRIVTTAQNAALANGMFGHADETDDTHPPSRTHPGTGIVPAVFSIGERNGLPGIRVLRALVLGYDICARMLLSFDEQVFRKSGHCASSFGQVFGAAAAVGALLRLDERKIRYALAYAGEQASGLSLMLRDSEHMEKAFGMGGMGARNGVAAALMASSGFSAVEDIFSGEHDFFQTFAPTANRNLLVQRLGINYEILRCGIKRWPAGGPIQGPLHVLNDLLKKYELRASDIEKMTVHMPDTEFQIVNNRQMPNICVQHMLALLAVDGEVTFHSAHDHERMHDPALLAFRKRMQIVPDPSLRDKLRRWRCVMHIEMSGGRKVSHKTMGAKGSFVNPLTRTEEEEKCLDLIVPVLGTGRAKKLIKAVWDFDRIPNVCSMRPLLQA